MLYKNKVTGGLIETDCSISGGDWEPVPAPKKGGGKPKGKGKDAAGAEDTGGSTLGKAGEDTPAEP